MAPQNPTGGQSGNHFIREILNRLDELTEADQVSVRDVVDAFGRASFLPMMIVPALLVVSPLSGVPLFSSLCGVTVAIIAGQAVFNRDSLWLPDWIMRRNVAGDRLHEGVRRVGKVADWVDRHTRDRWRTVTQWPLNRFVFLACMICGLCMPFLEFVPFSSSILGLAIILFSAGLLARDGLFVIVGGIVMCSAASVPFFIFGTVFGG